MVAQHDSYGPFVVVFGQPKIVDGGVAAVRSQPLLGQAEEWSVRASEAARAAVMLSSLRRRDSPLGGIGYMIRLARGPCRTASKSALRPGHQKSY